MSLTKEQIQKVMNCKTADELLALAKSEGVELTREQADELLAKMKTTELTEDELEKVAGGWSWIRGIMDLMSIRSPATMIQRI